MAGFAAGRALRSFSEAGSLALATEDAIAIIAPISAAAFTLVDVIILRPWRLCESRFSRAIDVKSRYIILRMYFITG